LRKKNKRYSILLEVMIAFALVVLCALPLLYSHTYILREQQAFLQKIKLDHIVNLLYAQFYERLQTNEIPWESIVDGTPRPIDPLTIKQLNNNQPLPFQGQYQLKIEKRKPKGKEEPFTLNLLKLTFTFTASGLIRPYTYEYLIFAGRQLQQTEPDPQQNSSTKPSSDPSSLKPSINSTPSD
jgi:hypothetical protein